MAEILGAATTATKYFLEVNQVTIDNATFKLFYKATTTLLLACSLVTSSKQFFGDPINCEVVRPSLYSFYASDHFGGTRPMRPNQMYTLKKNHFRIEILTAFRTYLFHILIHFSHNKLFKVYFISCFPIFCQAF